MMSSSDKKEKKDKFKLRVAGQPALEPPKPRPLPEEHPASLLFVGEKAGAQKPAVEKGTETQSPSLSEVTKKDGTDVSSPSLSGLQETPKASSVTTVATDDLLPPKGEMLPQPPNLAGAGDAVISDTVSSSPKTAGIVNERDARSEDAIRRSYLEFERRMKLVLKESHIKMLRLIFENTLAINEKAYRIAGPTLAEKTGVKRRQVSNILFKLEALNLIKHSQWKEGNRDLGLTLKFTANIFSL